MPNGHVLGDPEPIRDQQGRTVFRAACQCMKPGSYWYADRLPIIYGWHQAHLNTVLAKSRAAHPSARGPR